MDYIKLRIKEDKSRSSGMKMYKIGRFESNFADSGTYDLNLIMHALSLREKENDTDKPYLFVDKKIVVVNYRTRVANFNVNTNSSWRIVT